jgi:hypothetical protein
MVRLKKGKCPGLGASPTGAAANRGRIFFISSLYKPVLLRSDTPFGGGDGVRFPGVIDQRRNNERYL